MPPSVTASTGIDALTHAIEAYVSLQANAITDTLALRAIMLIAENLGQAFREGNDLIARESMLMGSLLAAMAYRNAGLGAVHALSNPLGQVCGVSHGVANGVLLPSVMEFNSESSPAKFTRIAQALGERVDDLSLPAVSEKAIFAVTKLLSEVEIPQRPDMLKGGITPDTIQQMASSAMMEVTYFLDNNPRKLTRADAIRIYESLPYL